MSEKLYRLKPLDWDDKLWPHAFMRAEVPGYSFLLLNEGKAGDPDTSDIVFEVKQPMVCGTVFRKEVSSVEEGKQAAVDYLAQVLPIEPV